MTTELWDIYDKNRVKTGRTVDRGKMTEAIANDMIARREYHIIVHVWYKNPHGEFLISKRSPNKEYGNLWEPTGGSAITGEDSMTAALREGNEELGVSPDPKSGRLLKTINRSPMAPDFLDVWLFDLDMPIERVVLQEGETCDAMWATKEKILEMIDSGTFIPFHLVPYIGLAQQTGNACKQDVCGEIWYNKSYGNHRKQQQNPPIGDKTSVSRTRESGKHL
jgi:8-oxo-dGTP pyrophosphatase MutT (NUDIX family)